MSEERYMSQNRIKVVFLGTNGWYTTETGHTTCVFIETKVSYIILDAGNGIYRITDYVTSAEKPIYLFLSHFHLDHINGLHILNKFKFAQGLTICCYKGGKGLLDNIIRQPYTVAFADLPLKIDIKELDEGRREDFPFRLEAREMTHSSRCFGYRFEIGDKVVSYCTDTGYSRTAVELSKDADLLIAECTLKYGQKNAEWPHLNPEDAAKLAMEANAKKLVLMHFDADIYQTLKERKEARLESKKIFKNVFAAEDGMVVEVC